LRTLLVQPARLQLALLDPRVAARSGSLRVDTCWTGGTWLWLHAKHTDPPAWLRTHTGVSIGHSPFHRRDTGGWELVREHLLIEV
jgi:hypothetical protein